MQYRKTFAFIFPSLFNLSLIHNIFFVFISSTGQDECVIMYGDSQVHHMVVFYGYSRLLIHLFYSAGLSSCLMLDSD